MVSLSYYPLVYLPVVASLSVLDAAGEEVAWSLGRSRARTIVTVVLPRIAPAVLGGALLVSLHVLAEFGALQLLAFQTFTTAIYGQYRSAFASEGGTVLAGVLVTACVLLLTLELLARGRRRWARVGSGTSRPAEPVRLGRARLPLLAALTGLVALTLGVPLYALGRWLVLGTSTEFVASELLAAFGGTLGLALGGALITTALALAPAWLAVRRRGTVAVLLERATYTANALPGIVVALALVWVTIRVVPSIYQTLPVLLAAYAILFLPRAVVSVRASLEQAPVVLEEISHSLGQSTLVDLPPGDRAAGRPRARRGCRADLPCHQHRADRDLDPRPDRHDHAGHPVLVRLVLGPLRRRRAVRPAADPRLPARHVVARASGTTQEVVMSDVRIEGLTKSYGDQRVLQGLDLHVPGRVAHVGPRAVGLRQEHPAADRGGLRPARCRQRPRRRPAR